MSDSHAALPPLAGLETARLDWSPGEDGAAAPLSARFDDVYFSQQDGRAETEHVFLDGNDLPRRFAAWREQRPFVIGETGFGTGLNMLCAWACFDTCAPASARLHLVSTERFPSPGRISPGRSPPGPTWPGAPSPWWPSGPRRWPGCTGCGSTSG